MELTIRICIQHPLSLSIIAKDARGARSHWSNAIVVLAALRRISHVATVKPDILLPFTWIIFLQTVSFILSKSNVFQKKPSNGSKKNALVSSTTTREDLSIYLLRYNAQQTATPKVLFRVTIFDRVHIINHFKI
mmetsp:Transcript_17906/g.41288  ORF Transcript_17906/g.41288 Transcript_17906/m.41288 type:complete len:134 (-) Transcript_17906:465-866(-)